jgi:3-oxoadipate enol-lactonase
MPEVEVNGVRLHYEDVGEGPETVVFSHSYLVDSRHFAPQIEALKPRYRVLAYDHRGHGQSEKPSTGYSMETIYADGLGFLEAMKLDTPCHWIGLSTGGFVGMRLGFRRPELLRSLILMDTAASGEDTLKVLKYRAMFLAVRLFGMKPVAGSAMAALFASEFLRDPARKAERETWRSRLLDNDTRALIAFGKAIFSRDDVRDRLPAIPVPTLVVVGEQDVSTPPAKAKLLAQAIPDARLERIPRAGHLCTVEQPEAVNRVLLEFLEQHSGPPAK